MSSIASLPALTIPSAIVLGLAIVLMLFSAQIAQRERRAQRRQARPHNAAVIPVPAPRYRSPNIVRRLLSLVTSGAIGVLIGTLVSIMLAYSIAYGVITLTRMLG